MLTSKTKIALSALFLTGAIAYAPTASAHDNSSQPRAGFSIGIVLGDHNHGRNQRRYRLDGYQSGYWYAWNRPQRRRNWNRRYGGYDCHPAFMFGYRNRNRARFEATICYDRHGNYFAARNSRREISRYNGRRWTGNRGRTWRNDNWKWDRIRRRDVARWQNDDRRQGSARQRNRNGRRDGAGRRR